jgi:6-pyruvoyltetrahydropterin/6-carboxytetrahydropterin synthase
MKLLSIIMVKFAHNLSYYINMAKIRVTKEFSFEMAHSLWNYDGPCRNVHGHSYRLFVTLAGVPVTDTENPKNGMVIDFNDLSKIIRKEIVDIFDHSVVVNKKVDQEKLKLLEQMFGNTLIVDYQPTCENLIVDFAERISRHIPKGVMLHNLRLYETAKSYTEWFACENE